MSINLPSLLKLSLAGAVILSVGACKAADKGQGALKSESVKALNLSKSESQVFAKYFETKSCEVDELESLGALAGLGLGENGDDGVNYASRDVNGGVVTYSNLEMREDGANRAAFSAKSVVFHCPKMGDADPTFDRVDLTDISIFDQDDNVEITAKTLNIASPKLNGARSIVGSMTAADAYGIEDTGFDAISITDVTIKSEDVNGTLASLSWGETKDESGRRKADLTFGDLDLTMVEPDGGKGMTVTVAFDGMSGRNIYIADTMDPNEGISADGMMASVFGNLNFFEKPYDEFLVETLKVDSEAFSFDFKGMEGKTTEKSGVITTRQSLKPMKFNMKPAMSEIAELREGYELMKSLGFETMTMSGSSVTKLDSNDDSISVSDGLLVIEDALRLNFEYQAGGLGAMTEKMKALAETDAAPDTMAAFNELTLNNFRLTMEDKSIVKRGLKLASEMTGQSETMIKSSLGMAVFAASMAAENELQAEVYSETLGAFADFVKKGGTLTIEANPPAPFPLAPLITGMGEDIDPATLGFSASQEGGSK